MSLADAVAEVLDELGYRYSPEQPRVPAGEPAGGQFGATEPAKPQEPPRSTMAYNPKTGRGPGYGVKGGDSNVRQLQAALNRLGLTDAKGKALTLDGKLGPKTTQAIMAAQQRLGLEVTGKVTPTFFKRLLAAKTLDDAKAKPAEPKSRPRKGRGQLGAAVRAVLDELGFRHLPGEHNQQSHAGFDTALDGLDDLELEGRIKLGVGETLVGSQHLGSSDQDGMVAVVAVVDGPAGRQFRVGVQSRLGSIEWDASASGDTAFLSEADFRSFTRSVGEGIDDAERRAKEADAAWASGTPPTDPALLGTAPVWEDAAGMRGSGIVAEAWLTDDDPVSWTLQLTADDESTMQMDADEAREFATELKTLGGAL